MAQTPWAVILCKFSDHPEEPQPPDFFRQFITTAGLGSYGAVDLTGSTVFGWFTMPQAYADFTTMSRFDKIMAGINTALANGVDFSTFYGILVMLNAAIDSGAIAPDPFGLTLSGVTDRIDLV